MEKLDGPNSRREVRSPRFFGLMMEELAAPLRPPDWLSCSARKRPPRLGDLGVNHRWGTNFDTSLRPP